jgi:pilus assembly protein CpaB
VAVAVASRDLPAGRRLAPRDVRLRPVPSAYVPRDAIAPRALAGGARTAVPVAAGSYLTAGLLRGRPTARAAALRPGERAVEVAVPGGPALAAVPPGSRVDVVVSTEPGERPGRTSVAIESAELLALRQGGEHSGVNSEGGGERPADFVATLRTTLREAVYLTAAQNFAREVRLLPRAPGDRRRTGRATVPAGGL